MPQSAHNAHRLVQRAALLAGAAGLVALQSFAPAVALVRPAASYAGAARPTATASARNSAVTVPGPRMYDPTTGGLYPPSTVTVSQTADLVNQVVKVSWTNFTPSIHVPYFNLQTRYPVMVAECQGDSPGSSPSDLSRCYIGSSGLGNTNGKFGPTTDMYTVTGSNGTGAETIQIQTSVQNQQLNCTAQQDCSLVILPAEGGNPGEPGVSQADCGNHRQDSTFATGSLTFNPPNSQSGYDTCAWPYRIVVPLHFAETPADCGFTQPDFSVVGSPFMQRAMTSWESALCHGSSPLDVSYDGLISEPQARSLFLQGGSDVALTTQPASGQGIHPYTYAPLGISASVFAYWLDSAKTGQPYASGVEMNPTLMTKELTQSYSYGYACPKQGSGQTAPIIPSGCDPNVMDDSKSLLTDPEFKQLNPNLAHLYQGGPPSMVPTVEGDASDMTWEVTRWIDASTAATQFLSGKFDAWGEHVNTDYLGASYPTQTFTTSDPTGASFFSFLPVPTPDKTSWYQSLNWWPGLDWNNPQPPGCGLPGQVACSYGAQLAEQPGRRQIAAITNNADATAFLFSAAALENHAGKYVLPTQASMAAAVSDMTTAANGITKDDNITDNNPSSYPLTMVSYAMVPTGGISHQKAVKIAQWLDFVAGHGQAQGAIPGQLPPGYLPLPASMRAQTLKAAFEVLHQTGNHGGHGNGPGSGPGSSSPGGNSPGKSTSGPGSGKSSPSGQIPPSKINAAYSSPDANGAARLALILMLALGALLAVAGPSAVVFSRPGARAAVVSAWRRVQALRGGQSPSSGGES